VANRHRYIGKETSRRWEQGEDLSIVDFRCTEYGNGKVIADKELQNRIVEMGIRKLARQTGIHSDTITLIAKGTAVKANTLSKVLGFIQGRSNP
jgi:hypothetical protein